MKYNMFTDQFGRLYLAENPILNGRGFGKITEDLRRLEQINEDKALAFSHEGEIELS